MILLSFIIPFLVAVVIAIFYTKKVAIWEYALLIGSSTLVTLLFWLIMKSVNTSDTEYLSYYVTKTTYYEPWNERVTKIRRVPCGTDKDGHIRYRTETYRVTEHHSESYEMILNNDDKINISEKKFNEIKNRFNVNAEFRDMHRNYYTKDGDAYDYYWDSTKLATLYPITKEHGYTNKVKGSKSIFNLTDISKDDIELYNLIDYPDVKEYQQPVVLGIDLPDSITQHVDILNSLYGSDLEFRLYLLFFKNQSPSVVEYQKSYWEGGNKNEIVLCLGYNGSTILWCEGFSWADSPIVETKCKEYFLTHPNINSLKEFTDFVLPVIRQHWVRKEFKDFDYLAVDLSTAQCWFLLIITLIVNGIGVYWIINNEYDLMNN